MSRCTPFFCMTAALLLAFAINVSRATDSNSISPLARPGGSAAATGQRSELDLLPVMPPKMVCETTVAGAQRLKAGFEPLDDTGTWNNYLRFDTLLHLASAKVPRQLRAEDKRNIQAILLVYDQLAKNPTYERITTLDGFQIIHASLDALLNPDYPNDRDRLIQSAYLLAEATREVGMGSNWRQMLAMPRNLPRPDLLTGRNLPQTIAQLRHMQQRFETVEQHPEFVQVAEMPAFRVTQANLEVYLTRLRKIAAISD